MPRAPKTYEDLRSLYLNHREAVTVAAILPNLPATDSLFILRGYAGYASLGFKQSSGRRYYTDDDVIAEFRKRHSPIVGTANVYRAEVEHIDDERAEYVNVTPKPYAWDTYEIKHGDFIEVISLDPSEYDFSDSPQSTLDEFGFDGSPYWNAYESEGEDYPRKRSVPV